ncbi:cytochrome o ubiquinol oxidase subunit IV [Mesorhizobium sp.]|jgi:cytochrome o ubiquinol oxidase operon protein cyoD|uniref:cytochrome o ubiquinol oxidase subunit IV n=1 Tax=Mesorhizobium sp. TaxID=1871066 RepID=UPI000FE3DB95|nr:cytochrome o ubiquinol oxidase subunit IV [Mesorhizobium sp.]RWH68291.1 MAG: cytochrome o ubiquinol oxidase subunit IV [Mesorhizobium sp.]RWL25131.1 MAG: cytochrome o ubiquinol oxidase subunit IV [Mesorhizobium sp.]RWL27636.1 MAG: cytochrome o ubiquinol oxidase subunit IV [Mesorhizobium sp.]RWL36280.1 MAG: cytochrome o ubiquinol oxidase subunit IV [Mesorhizobium sp.]RWL50950.1 MAG: cytochrome o ubiquinol oxidase subunit IV [Mesorhizobium sp.]
MIAHDHAGHDHAHGGAAHGSLKGYLIGFVLSVVLTAIPFWMVMTGAIDNKQATAVIIMAFAAVQIVVHMIFFLHMTPASEGGWSMLALIFTVILVVIVLSGSLWVMYHLNANMMPGLHEMRQMP